MKHFLSVGEVHPATPCEWSPTVMQRADIHYTLNKYVVAMNSLYIITSSRCMQNYNPRRQALRTYLSIHSFRGVYWHGWLIMHHMFDRLWLRSSQDISQACIENGPRFDQVFNYSLMWLDIEITNDPYSRSMWDIRGTLWRASTNFSWHNEA